MNNEIESIEELASQMSDEGFRSVGDLVDSLVDLGNTDKVHVRHDDHLGRGCAEFCVNGQSTAGASRPVRKHNEH